MKIKTYYLLTKPGIIIGNLITTVAGFVLGSKGHFDFNLFLATLAGLGLVIASACIFNNYIDREMDKKMERTQNRALAKGLISSRSAIQLAVLLGIAGTLILSLYTNLLTVITALAGFVIYVILYSLFKSKTAHATLIGSVSGAMPLVVGYCAASNHLDMAALLLFLIMVFWQMPHFFAIAMYRFKDYAAASVPVLPVEKGSRLTKIHMMFYIVAFIISAAMLTVFGYTGYTYLIIAALLGLSWLWLCIRGFKSNNDTLWARSMFRHSLVIITLLSIMISVDSF